MPTIERRVVRQRVRLCRVKRPLLFRIEDRYICKTTSKKRPAMREIENARRTRREQVHDPRQRNLVLAMQLRDRQSQRRLESGDAERSALKLHLFLVRSMRSVIGRNRIDGSIRQRN